MQEHWKSSETWMLRPPGVLAHPAHLPLRHFTGPSVVPIALAMFAREIRTHGHPCSLHTFIPFPSHKTHSFQMIIPSNYDNRCLIVCFDYTIIFYHINCVIKTSNYMGEGNIS